MKRILLVLLSMLSSCLFAFEAPKTPPKTASISGTVLRVGTNQPIKKVKLVLEGGSDSEENEEKEQPTTYTDEEGKFSFKNIGAGRYSLHIEKAGFAGQQSEDGRAPALHKQVTVSDGQAISDIQIRLVQAAAITGRVFDADGEPMPNVSVQALKYTYVDRKRQLQGVGWANTNDMGEYRVFGLTPGEYYISVTTFDRRGQQQTGSNDRTRYPKTYYPGTTDERSAAPISLRPGDESRADVTMNSAKVVKISGTVVGATIKKDGFKAFISLMSGSERGPVATTMVAADTDKFTLEGVFPGTYTVLAVAPESDDDKPKFKIARQQVTIGTADVEGVTLALDSRLAEVKGVVRVENAPADAKLDRLFVQLRPVNPEESAADPLPPGGAGQVEKDGKITLVTFGTGDFFPVIQGGFDNKTYYVKSVSYGGRDVTETGIPLIGRTSTSTFEIVLAAATGELKGSVVSGDKPAAEATVVAVPEAKFRSRPDLYYKTVTDQNGQFQFKEMRPGTYTLYSWEEVEDNAYMFPEFMAPFESRATTVRVADRSVKTDVTLKVIASENKATVSGQ